MARKVFLILLAVALALSVGLVACNPDGEEQEEEEEEEEEWEVTVWGDAIVRMDYASDNVTVGGTFDFGLTYPYSVPDKTGFLNVVADLNGNGSIDTEEWIVANIPLFLDSALVGVWLSVWFDPGGQNLTTDWMYDTWATVSEAQVDNLIDYLSWQYSQLPATNCTWGQNDPTGETGAITSDSEEADAGGNVISIMLRGGVPDIAQKKNECGPTSTANSLRWLAKEYNFEDSLPDSDDTLIRELMVAMKGSDDRPFPGLVPDEMFDGKTKYVGAEGKNLPVVVKGGMNDPDAVGAKAFDFIGSQLDAGCDVEFLICWPPHPLSGNVTCHWVTAVGRGVNGDRLFLAVHDSDDCKQGTVFWELRRDGTFVSPKGTMNRAVAECPLQVD